MTLGEAAAAAGVSASTLRRWVKAGVIPEFGGDDWTPAAIGKARLVARIRERGYSLAEIQVATADGRLALGQLAELFDVSEVTRTLRQAARETGLDVATIRRLAPVLGARGGERLGEADVRVLGYIAAAVDAGLPLEAMVQLAGVYAQALRQIADAEVRLVHMYVHEPLMRSGGAPDEMSRELATVAGELLPLVAPLLDDLHRRLLAQFVDQDIVGHMDTQLDRDDVGRVAVAIAFVDLVGYTQLTEEAGEEHAVDAVERFVAAVTTTVPEDARVVKTIGDEVMIVASDPVALAVWAFEFAARRGPDGRGPRGAAARDPEPRIAIHHGQALYRGGDYYGREVNRAARVASQSGPGEVLVTQAIVDLAAGALQVETLPEVELKGFAEPTAIYRVIGLRGGDERRRRDRRGRSRRRAVGDCSPRRRDAVRRSRLDLSARPGGHDRRPGGRQRLARQLRTA